MHFNPSGLPIEVYDMTIGEWVITSTHSPITLPTGVREILLSLRPNSLEPFHHKPGFAELLQRLPRVQRLLRTPSKRAATESLVSPRTHKRVQYDPLHPILKPVPAIAVPIPEDDENSFQPPSPRPHQPDPTPLPPPTANTLPRRPVTKAQRFPSQFLACDILSKVSEYHMERTGKHGEFLDILKRICTPHTVGRTTAAELVKSYKQNRPHFMTLDRNIQLSITWSELGRRAKAANTPPDSAFLAFVDVDLGPPIIIDRTVSTSPVIFTEAAPHTTPPTAVDPKLAVVPATPTNTTSQLVITEPITHIPAPFPLDASVLQPLLPEQRGILDAEYNLICAISKDLGDVDTTWIEDPQGVHFQLRCPFCDTELPGTEYSLALKGLLNSKYIQENTEPDPTLQNPNARRSLGGHQVYSDFCSQHRLEELLPAAKAAGWPYPPDFANIQHRVHSKGSYINGLTMGIQTGLNPSKFYLEILAMSERQRREQAQDIVAAG